MSEIQPAPEEEEDKTGVTPEEGGSAEEASAEETTETGEEEGTDENDGPDFLSMSDEDFAKAEAAAQSQSEEEAPAPEEDGGSETTSETDPNEGTGEGDEAAGAETGEVAPEDASATGSEASGSQETTPAEPAGTEEKPGGTGEQPKPAASSGSEVTDKDKLTAYDTIMAPFTANGKQVQARTPAEAVRLMQMGAGHVKYQKQVRPMVAQAQALKKAGIGQDELNFLIEVHNKNPDAIKKLVRDAGIDPYDIETTDEAKAKDKDFKAKDYSVDDRTIALEENVAAVHSSEKGPELLAHIRSDSWDAKSRQALLADPNIVNILADQKHSGVYDQITAEIDRKQLLGELPANISFLDTYYQVGTELENSGAFKQADPEGEATKETAQPAESKVIETAAAKPKKEAGGDPSGVASSPSTPATTPKMDEGLLNMSDEEFRKLESEFVG